MDIETAYRKYYNDLFNYAYYLSHNVYIAEDVVAETFLRAIDKINTYKDEATIKSWLLSIAHNYYINYLRKISRIDNVENSYFTNLKCEDHGFVCVEESNVDGYFYIHEQIHNMKFQDKEIIMLRLFCKLSFKDIGRIFDKTENWACITYHRARKRLAYSLQNRI